MLIISWPDAGWQTVSAIVSALFAIVAAGISIYTVVRTLRLSALVALEQRFSAINHAKIQAPEAWESIRDNQELKPNAKHLVFETFQFYHQAFVLRRRRAIRKKDYVYWERRLKTDIKEFPSYRIWWNKDQKRFHDSWDEEFVKHIKEEIWKIENSAKPPADLPPETPTKTDADQKHSSESQKA